MSAPVLDHVYLHRVRYRECDPMGVVYHTHYIDYFEVARTEALREMGLAYKTLEDEGVIMPVIDLAVQYKRPARYDDLLAITSIVRERPRMRLRIDYEVRNAETQPILVTGHVTLCFVDAERGRPIPAPPRVIEVFDALG
ncbi:MAG: thioesterase family protein [Bacteroidota bacterium]